MSNAFPKSEGRRRAIDASSKAPVERPGDFNPSHATHRCAAGNVSTDSDNVGMAKGLLEPLTFYTMEKRADDIGQEGLYAILRLIFLAVRPDSKLRINLLGHSFGCKVVCAALERLAVNSIAVPPSITFNVLLLQAAFATDSLDAGGAYEHVVPTFRPWLRMLVSRSAADDALGKAFPAARAINWFHQGVRTALGATGPSGALKAAFATNQDVAVAWDSTFLGSVAAPPTGPLLVSADLSVVTRIGLGLCDSDGQ
jgi:hypothetical protein